MRGEVVASATDVSFCAHSSNRMLTQSATQIRLGADLWARRLARSYNVERWTAKDPTQWVPVNGNELPLCCCPPVRKIIPQAVGSRWIAEGSINLVRQGVVLMVKSHPQQRIETRKRGEVLREPR